MGWNPWPICRNCHKNSGKSEAQSVERKKSIKPSEKKKKKNEWTDLPNPIKGLFSDTQIQFSASQPLEIIISGQIRPLPLRHKGQTLFALQWQTKKWLWFWFWSKILKTQRLIIGFMGLLLWVHRIKIIKAPVVGFCAEKVRGYTIKTVFGHCIKPHCSLYNPIKISSKKNPKPRTQKFLSDCSHA